MRHKQYIQMFRSIAESNADIQHTDNKPAFVRVIKSVSEPFEDKLYLEEFINKNYNNLNYPCLLIMSYSAGYEGEPDTYLNKHHLGMFSVLHRAHTRQRQASKFYDDLDEKLDEAERISESILITLSESLQAHGCKFLGLEGISADKSGPDMNGIVAQSVYFNFTTQTNIEV